MCIYCTVVYATAKTKRRLGYNYNAVYNTNRGSTVLGLMSTVLGQGVKC